MGIVVLLLVTIQDCLVTTTYRKHCKIHEIQHAHTNKGHKYGWACMKKRIYSQGQGGLIYIQ